MSAPVSASVRTITPSACARSWAWPCKRHVRHRPAALAADRAKATRAAPADRHRRSIAAAAPRPAPAPAGRPPRTGPGEPATSWHGKARAASAAVHRGGGRVASLTPINVLSFGQRCAGLGRDTGDQRIAADPMGRKAGHAVGVDRQLGTGIDYCVPAATSQRRKRFAWAPRSRVTPIEIGAGGEADGPRG